MDPREKSVVGLILVNPFMPNVLSFIYQLDESISNFRVHGLCFKCPVFLMLSRLFIAALWSPAGKGLGFALFVDVPQKRQ